jgi:hypothetical protein
MSPPLIVTADEVDTALRLFTDAVAAVAGEHGEVLRSARAARAISGVEAGG